MVKQHHQTPLRTVLLLLLLLLTLLNNQWRCSV
jgi:hypothetical protein